MGESRVKLPLKGWTEVSNAVGAQPILIFSKLIKYLFYRCIVSGSSSLSQIYLYFLKL